MGNVEVLVNFSSVTSLLTSNFNTNIMTILTNFFNYNLSVLFTWIQGFNLTKWMDQLLGRPVVAGRCFLVRFTLEKYFSVYTFVLFSFHSKKTVLLVHSVKRVFPLLSVLFRRLLRRNNKKRRTYYLILKQGRYVCPPHYLFTRRGYRNQLWNVKGQRIKQSELLIPNIT